MREREHLLDNSYHLELARTRSLALSHPLNRYRTLPLSGKLSLCTQLRTREQTTRPHRAISQQSSRSRKTCLFASCQISVFQNASSHIRAVLLRRRGRFPSASGAGVPWGGGAVPFCADFLACWWRLLWNQRCKQFFPLAPHLN